MQKKPKKGSKKKFNATYCLQIVILLLKGYSQKSIYKHPPVYYK